MLPKVLCVTWLPKISTDAHTHILVCLGKSLMKQVKSSLPLLPVVNLGNQKYRLGNTVVLWGHICRSHLRPWIIPNILNICCNAKFSAALAHFWIYLSQYRSTPKVWKKYNDGQDSASEAHPPSSTHHLTQSVRQGNRRHQVRDTYPSNAESRCPPTEPPQPSWPTKHDSPRHQEEDALRSEIPQDKTNI